MATNSFHLDGDGTVQKKHAWIYKVDDITIVNAKLDALMKWLERMGMKVINTTLWSEICRGWHTSMECNMIS